jgi:hypothetical protein
MSQILVGYGYPLWHVESIAIYMSNINLGDSYMGWQLLTGVQFQVILPGCDFSACTANHDIDAEELNSLCCALRPSLGRNLGGIADHL